MKKCRTTIVIALLVLSACTQDPTYVAPVYVPPAMPYGYAMPTARPAPRRAPPVIEASPSDPTPVAPVASDRPAAEAVPAAGDDDRFQHLKDSLEKEGNVSVPADRIAATPDKAAAGNCTTVQTRNGFHDHYGGLNSAGDVAHSCAP